MQTVFIVESLWNRELVERVIKRHQKLGNGTDSLKYLDVEWRIVSEDELRIEILGVRIKTVPRVLRNVNYTIDFYDYLANARFAAGLYLGIEAAAEVTVTTKANGKTLHKIKITGSSLRAVNNLYTLIIWRQIEPSAR